MFHRTTCLCVFPTLADHIETTVYKRRAAGKKYGVVIVQEGVGAVIDKDDIKSIFGSLNVCYEELGEASGCTLGYYLMQLHSVLCVLCERIAFSTMFAYTSFVLLLCLLLSHR